MINSKVYNLFRILDRSELRKCTQFLKSPIHNKRNDVIKLFNYFKNTPKDKIDFRSAFGMCYPTEQYVESKLRHTMTYLCNLIKEFMALESWKKDTHRLELSFAKALYEKGANERSIKALLKLKKSIKSGPIKSSNRLFFEVNRFYNQLVISDSRKADFELELTIRELHNSFYSDILEQACNVRSVETIKSGAFNIPLLNPVLTALEREMNLPATIEIWLLAYRLASRLIEDDSFEKFVFLFDLNHNSFVHREQRQLTLIGINYCIYRANLGEKGFIHSAFKLYKKGLEKDYLLDSGRMTKFTYRNIINHGLALKEYDWVENFMLKYQSYIDKKDRENTYRYNRARVLFAKGQYSKTLELLRDVDFLDIGYNLDARRMMLRIYYAKNETDVLISLLDSFYIYILRNERKYRHAKSYKPLLKFTSKLLSAPYKTNQWRANLLKQIESTDIFIDKGWLVEEVAKLDF